MLPLPEGLCWLFMMPGMLNYASGKVSGFSFGNLFIAYRNALPYPSGNKSPEKDNYRITFINYNHTFFTFDRFHDLAGYTVRFHQHGIGARFK